MADTTNNEVFDRLSQSFKDSTLGQSFSSVVSQPDRIATPEDKLLLYISYKEWLKTVKSDYESALVARRKEDTTLDQDQLNENILHLQQELLQLSTSHSLKELALKRLQLSDTLLQVIFPPAVGQTSSPNQRQKFRDLMSKQCSLVTEVRGHQKVCQRVQEELDNVRKNCLEMKKKNRDAMTELLKINEEKKQEDASRNDEKQQRIQSDIDRTVSHILIGRNLLQGLMIGSGINWAQDDQLRELMLNLGKPVQLEPTEGSLTVVPH